MSNFRDLVVAEKINARNAYGGLASMHEIYGVLSEELFEFFEEVRKKPNERDPENATKELVQLAAISEMAAEDMGLVERVDVSEGKSPYQEKYEELLLKLKNFSTVATVVQDNLQRRRNGVLPTESEFEYLIVPRQIYKDLVDTVND